MDLIQHECCYLLTQLELLKPSSYRLFGRTKKSSTNAQMQTNLTLNFYEQPMHAISSTRIVL